MQVHGGEIFGLLGPNGAGKSTLVKIMMTVVRPTKVGGTLLGQPLGHKPTLGKVGYLPEHHRFPRYLTGRQALEYYGALAKVDRATRKRRAAQLLETVGMSQWGDKKVSSYSKGMMQRVGLAQALINDPTLIVLDEPTDGVDPVGRREIRDLLVSLREQGKTVFVNSHLLSDLEEMRCDRVAILVQGQVAMQGTIEELTAESQRYEIIIKGSPPTLALGDTPMRINSLENGQTLLTFPRAKPDDVQPVIDALRAKGIVICSVCSVRETLEQLFMRAVTDPHTGRTLPPGARIDSKPLVPAVERGSPLTPEVLGEWIVPKHRSFFHAVTNATKVPAELAGHQIPPLEVSMETLARVSMHGYALELAIIAFTCSRFLDDSRFLKGGHEGTDILRFLRRVHDSAHRASKPFALIERQSFDGFAVGGCITEFEAISKLILRYYLLLFGGIQPLRETHPEQARFVEGMMKLMNTTNELAPSMVLAFLNAFRGPLTNEDKSPLPDPNNPDVPVAFLIRRVWGVWVENVASFQPTLVNFMGNRKPDFETPKAQDA
ncbi:MAG: ABC transporter ATP-binding protein [Phycisphaerales bacterium]|nr:ABC transporter ATP-binding protein [Phycisphaerales bacterium]MCI0630473.1 ABC transporter ATP-binding protein [Phycisphaerales bacterium]